MKCKYCKQKIGFFDWIIFCGRCSPCDDIVWGRRLEQERERDAQENKLSEKYWKTQERKKK